MKVTCFEIINSKDALETRRWPVHWWHSIVISGGPKLADGERLALLEKREIIIRRMGWFSKLQNAASPTSDVLVVLKLTLCFE